MSDIEEAISLVATALKEAEEDAKTGKLIFRPEWRHTPRSSPDTGKSSWWSSVVSTVLDTVGRPRKEVRSEQDQPPHPPPLSTERPGLSSTGKPRSTTSPPTSVPVPSPISAPAIPLALQIEGPTAELLKRNKDVFDKLLNHPFPQALGNGTASLDGFRYYMIQDKEYVKAYYRLKMRCRLEDYENIKTIDEDQRKTLKYVADMENICITMLGVDEKTMNGTPRSVQLDTSESFYDTSIRFLDPVLGFYVALLPCIMSYRIIADRLVKDSLTAQNTVYHKAWTELNYDTSSAESVGKYTKFINANIEASGGVKKWNYVFRIACILEAEIFNTGFQAPTPYQVIPDGIYSIQSPSLDNAVLAVQNVKSALESPFNQILGQYFPKNAVVGVSKTGKSNEGWRVISTKDGYTFQNAGTGLYLGVTAESDRQEGRILQAAIKPSYWWINPVPDQESGKSRRYKIYESVNLRYTLHAHTQALDLANELGETKFPYTPIVSRDNSEASKPFQIWSFHDESGNPSIHTINNFPSIIDDEPSVTISHPSNLHNDPTNNPPKVVDILAQANKAAELGDKFLQQDKLDEATASYVLAAQLYGQGGDVLGEANNLTKVGDVYLRRDRLGNAEEFYKRAAALRRQKNDVMGEANDAAKLGDVYLRRRALDEAEAEASYMRAVGLHVEVDNVLGEVDNLVKIADLHLRQDRLREAEDEYEAASGLHNSVQDALGEARDSAKLGDISLRQGMLNEAKVSYKHAVGLYEQEHDTLGRESILQIVTNLATAKSS